MTRPLIQIGTEVREMTTAEFEQWQTDQQAHAANIEAAADAAKARATALAKLEALGLTPAEIAALVG
jgi:hypothetical protein